jgi:hypothetical protein
MRRKQRAGGHSLRLPQSAHMRYEKEAGQPSSRRPTYLSPRNLMPGKFEQEHVRVEAGALLAAPAGLPRCSHWHTVKTLSPIGVLRVLELAFCGPLAP